MSARVCMRAWVCICVSVCEVVRYWAAGISSHAEQEKKGAFTGESVFSGYSVTLRSHVSLR